MHIVKQEIEYRKRKEEASADWQDTSSLWIRISSCETKGLRNLSPKTKKMSFHAHHVRFVMRGFLLDR